MTLDSSHPNFRYPNDNRLVNVGVNIYPSQGMPDPSGSPGFGGSPDRESLIQRAISEITSSKKGPEDVEDSDDIRVYKFNYFIEEKYFK